ncbi:MAG: CoA transferase subunit A [Terriglobales bacterium]
MNKRVASAQAAVADIPDGATVMIGGFGLCGNPEHLIRALAERGTRDLTVISNNAGTDGEGIGALLAAGQIRKMIASYVGENSIFEARMLSGDLETELVPQGTLAERIRAGGAGIPAFYTPAGVGTRVAEGRETREFAGRPYLLATALRADFALIKAQRGDRWGNLTYRATARNFNAVMASAAAVTIAEVEDFVELGDIDPEMVATPGIYVRRLVVGTAYRKPIERRTTRRAGAEAAGGR